MAKKDDPTELIVKIVLILVALPFVIIVWLFKAASNTKIKRKEIIKQHHVKNKEMIISQQKEAEEPELKNQRGSFKGTRKVLAILVALGLIMTFGGVLAPTAIVTICGIILFVPSLTAVIVLIATTKDGKGEMRKEKIISELCSKSLPRINKRVKAFVEANSSAINEIKKLNSEYVFHKEIQSVIEKKVYCDSKRELDNLNFEAQLNNLAHSDSVQYKIILQKLYDNKILYEKYLSRINDIQFITTENFATIYKGSKPKIKYRKFLRIEESLFLRLKKDMPKMNISINFSASYTSPAGRNSYSRKVSYSQENMRKCFYFFEYAEPLTTEEKKAMRESEAKKKEYEAKKKEQNRIKEKELERVMSISPMCKELWKLNRQYTYEDINKTYYHNYEYKSKQRVINTNFDVLLYQILSEEDIFYENILLKAKKNERLHAEYINKYENINSYSDTSLINKMSDAVFREMEKELYDKDKQKAPITEIEIIIKAEYTSPTGASYYTRDKRFSANEICNTLDKIETDRVQEVEAIIQKTRAAEEKRQKERKLKELDRKEAQLLEKEREIEEKAQLFLKATKGHIYSTDEQNVSERVVINATDTLVVKLKKLKMLLDEGALTLEEYNKKRKELI